jgi:hypothetical protein
MSDAGKAWWKVTGLAGAPDGVIYVFAASELDARERAGRAWLAATPAGDDDAVAWFTRQARQARRAPHVAPADAPEPEGR